jgi:Na+/H+ antiporter NhaC
MTTPAATAPPPPLLTFRGGLAGALLPFVVFLAGVGWLGLSGAPDERGFWPVLVAALTVGLLITHDRRRFIETMLAGMARPLVMLMVMAWSLAGILSALLGASGFIQALVWMARWAGLAGGGYVAGAFLVCAVVATSTGTSLGTILICGPLLYPAGAAVGAAPAMLIGAILAGATFGDSISPISDTTIASAGTQGADIGGVVRARAKYVLPAGLVMLVAAVVFGGGGQVPASISAAATPGDPRGLPMLAVPAVVISLLLARRHLLEGLLAGSLVALAIGLPLGLIRPDQLLRIDPGSFAARSLVIDGIERSLGVVMFTLLLVGLVSTVEATGALGRLVEFVRGRAASRRSAEIWIVGAVTGAVLLTTHSVVAILTVGEFARETGLRVGIGPYRRANLLDVTVCTWPFTLPYFLPAILAANATGAGAPFGMPRVSPLATGVHNIYSWALLGMVVFAVATGYGRTEGPPDEVTS